MGTLIQYIAKLGITKLEVDLTGYTVGSRASRKLPVRANAMRQIHDAAEHDLWFSEQVNRALNEAESTHATWLDTQDVHKRIKQRDTSRMDSVND